MGSKETRRIPKHACTGRLVIVALSAQPPGVNELCVCVYSLVLIQRLAKSASAFCACALFLRTDLTPRTVGILSTQLSLL